MRLLLDSCIGVRTRLGLQDAGHAVAYVAELGPDPGDRAVLARAHAEQRILITRDADFGRLAVFERQPHAGIIRLLDALPEKQVTISLRVLEQYGARLQAGALVTAGSEAVRIRMPE